MILYRTIGNHVIRPGLKLVYRAEVRGAERVPDGGCIVASNHESLIDPFVLGLATERVIHYMAKAELWRYPVLRQLMEGFGAFPVARGEGDRLALTRASRLLERGEVVGIFPQGTCLPYPRRPWRRGAARLALATGAPLVPVALVDTEKALRPKRVRIGFPKLRVLIGEPLEIERSEPTPEAAASLTDRLERAVQTLRAPYGEPAHAWID